MSSDAAKNAYPDPPGGFTMIGEKARLQGLREAYDRGAREEAVRVIEALDEVMGLAMSVEDALALVESRRAGSLCPNGETGAKA